MLLLNRAIVWKFLAWKLFAFEITCFFKCHLSLFFIFRESALAAKHSCEVLKDKPIERVQRSNNTKETTPTSKVIDYFDFSTQWAVPLNWKSLHLLFRECFISCMIAYTVPLVWCSIFFFQFCDKRVFFFIIRKLSTLAQESLQEDKKVLYDYLCIIKSFNTFNCQCMKFFLSSCEKNNLFCSECAIN